jgi:hypothetical protein
VRSHAVAVPVVVVAMPSRADRCPATTLPSRWPSTRETTPGALIDTSIA